MLKHDDNLPIDDMMTIRREAVSALRARHMTQRQIVENLKKFETPIITSLASVNRDIRYLRLGWIKRANDNTDRWIADELADLDELEKAAWKEKRYELVLRIKERRSKLLGLDKPDEHKLLGDKDNPIVIEVKSKENAEI